jgi:hypothetical protein
MDIVYVFSPYIFLSWLTMVYNPYIAMFNIIYTIFLCGEMMGNDV